ncbi:MAG: segregation/condensation protein A [Oscillospiraceae bacterium]|jgi:segregation and condensation protein A|nr:segregation/condensation protein A [Oscillospiraceae bacterium]
MSELVFHLPGALKSRGEQTDFTGPLSLILQLLSRSRIEVRDISVSQILEQYLTWLDEMAEMDLDVASEFVAMASHLMFIKSRTLLGDSEPEELVELISSLERLRATDVYAQIKPLVPTFQTMYYNGAGLICKTPEWFEPDESYRFAHGADELARAFEMILLRTVSPDEVMRSVRGSAPRPIAFPIDTKIAELTERMRRYGSVELAAVFRECTGRSETVAAFLAVLELCAAGRATLDEDAGRIQLTIDN